MEVSDFPETVATNASRWCGKCGSKIFADAPQGFCGLCLFKTGLGSPGEDDDSLESGPVAMPTDFDDYDLLREIGRGGQGVVYRARQKSLNRTVALKVIGVGHWASEAHLRRFRLEAEAAASLNHPFIVPIHEIRERHDCCYFSMNLVDGGQLDEVVKRQAISIRRAAELIAKLARTVHYAHEHGILHRDINNTVIMPAGSKITYKATGTISASASGSISDTATVTAPSGATDPSTANNSATDTDTL